MVNHSQKARHGDFAKWNNEGSITHKEFVKEFVTPIPPRGATKG
jgi:hypothetical protein